MMPAPLGWIPRLWRGCAVLLWLVFVVLWLLIVFVGQSWSPTATLVYLPPLFGPLLLLVVALPGWWWGRRLLVLLAFTAVLALGPGLGWRSHQNGGFSTAPTLRVMTCNRGQHHGHDIAGFVSTCQPDLLAIQDGVTPAAYTPGSAAIKHLVHTARLGEFVLLSRFPILQTSGIRLNVRWADGRVRTWYHSARHLLQAGDRQIVVYNVHLPSPRHALTGSSGPISKEENFWELQRQVQEELLSHVEAEMLPTIVLGDWNIPPLGPRYRRMTRSLVDAHAVAGEGYGFTVPGDVRHLLAFHQPWLRLDYILSSREWAVETCATEPSSVSQHAAVFAELRLR